MTRRHAVLRRAGLALALALVVGAAPPSPRAADLEIVVEDPSPAAAEKIDLGRRFGTDPCGARQASRTILDALGPDARKVLVHHVASREPRTPEAVKGYATRILSAEPEGGKLSPAVHWAEMRQVEILASVEFADGQRRPLHLASGYAHLQDRSGCEWWARYLGPDRSKWVVW